jgi:hypothetical protein
VGKWRHFLCICIYANPKHWRISMSLSKRVIWFWLSLPSFSPLPLSPSSFVSLARCAMLHIKAYSYLNLR